MTSSDNPTTMRWLRARWILSGLVVFVLLWSALLASTSLGPHVDNIEQLTWVRSIEWGYYKHPPLPTWLIWPFVQIFGLQAGVSFLMGALCKGLALAGFWWLMLRLRGPVTAFVALLAACCISYYSAHLNLYNHNVVMMLSLVAAADCTWQAWRRRSGAWWCLLGVVLGLGLLTKYQTVVTITSVLVFFVASGAWQEAVHRRGLALALLLALLIFLPHLLWVMDHPLNPITYARQSSLEAAHLWQVRVRDVSAWVGDHFFNRGLGSVLLLLTVGWILWPQRLSDAAAQSVPSSAGGVGENTTDPARALIFSFSLVPLGFVMFLGLALGAELRKHWGTPFLFWLVPATMEVLRRIPWGRAPVRVALLAFLVIQSLLVAYEVFVYTHRDQLKVLPRWGQPMAQFWAPAIAEKARLRLGGPIRVVAGPETVASAFALELPERPLVLINGDRATSPWVPLDIIENCGMVVLSYGLDSPFDEPLVGGPPGMVWRAVAPAQGRSCP